jgi:hypothetical protein
MSTNGHAYLRASGIVPVIINIMKTRCVRSDIVTSVLMAVISLAKDDVTLGDLITAGVCELMVDISRPYMTNHSILNAYSRAFIALVKSNEGAERMKRKHRNTLRPDELYRVFDGIAECCKTMLEEDREKYGCPESEYESEHESEYE